MMPVTESLCAYSNTGEPGQESASQHDRYLFISGLVKAMELHLLDQARLNRLLDASEPEEISRILGECNYPSGKNPEEILGTELAGSLGWLQQMMPDPAYADALIIFHDAHNLKLVVKHLLTLWITGPDADKISRQTPAINSQVGTEETILPDFGGLSGIPPFGRTALQALKPAQVDPDFLYHQIAEHRSDGLPEWIFQAAVEAVRRYLVQYDMSTVDAWLDQVAWRQAFKLAETTGNHFLMGWLCRKTDLINLEMLLRTRTMRSGREILGNALLPGGLIMVQQVMDLYGETEDAIVSFYSKTSYASLAEICRVYGKPGQTTPYGLLADNLLMEHIRSARWIISGPEVPLAWVMARHTEIKNIRIILTCLRNSLPKTQARDLMRDSYLPWR
ncbi:MAG: V-type ATPase subunit [Bacillota bacterium]|nr:V-type ATPase subunit [Bacillota bacterium]